MRPLRYPPFYRARSHLVSGSRRLGQAKNPFRVGLLLRGCRSFCVGAQPLAFATVALELDLRAESLVVELPRDKLGAHRKPRKALTAGVSSVFISQWQRHHMA